jgi:cation:H+ antiporter
MIVTVVGLVLLALAAALLLVGAELFAEHAAGAGRRLGITGLAVGLLLAGAEPEELLTAMLAAAEGRPELAAGDAIGANATMLTLALGAAALARPLPFGHDVRRYALWAAAAGALAAATLLDGAVDRLEGTGLLLAYGVGVAAVWWRERRPPAIGEVGELTDEPGGHAGDDEPTARAVGLALAGIGLMLAGGWLAVEGASRVVAALDVDESAVGLTLLALATTAELFALAWSAARRGVSELAVAGVVGSAAYNATVTLGAAALVRPLEVPGMLAVGLVAAGLPLVVIALGWGGRLGRVAGLLLVGGYAAYVVAVVR